MPKNRSPFRNQLEDKTAGLFLWLFSRVRRETAETMGRRMGKLFRVLSTRRRHLAEQNLKRAFPEMPEDTTRRLAGDVFAHFGGVFAELVWLASRPSAGAIESVLVTGLENAVKARDSGRGFFFLTAHLGNWEVAAIAAAAHGLPMKVIARPLDNPLLDDRLRRFREQTGNTVVSKREAAREVIRTLRQGGAIGILPDQHAHPPDAITVPFFERPASTTSAIARFVLRTECLLLPAAALRTGPCQYHLFMEKSLDVRALREEERTLERLTALVNEILEGLIRKDPAQWLWLHNRWRLD